MNMNTPVFAIDAHELTVVKQAKKIVRNVSFTVEQGTIVGLIGPSGSGKTTLLRTIVGTQRSASGTLQVLGYDAGAQQLRTRIGYVTQAPAIYDDLTVAQNMRYFASLRRATTKDIQDILVKVQLSDQKNQIAQTLSGGQKTRLSLAVALLGNPQLLVLDEPTVGLDPLLRRELWEFFVNLAATGTTLIISSHVMDEADQCGRLLLMREGTLLWSGSTSGLLQKTRTSSVEAAFIAMIKKEEQA
jgi:ABC-2 type transport system ATP-binding protein